MQSEHNATIALILTTLQTRILGFAKARVMQAKIATALGNKRNPIKSINKELKGLAHISKKGYLCIENEIEAEITKIAKELEISDTLKLMHHTKIVFMMGATSDEEADETEEIVHKSAHDSDGSQDDSEGHLPFA